MNKVFAPEYTRDNEGRVLFGRDTNLRASLFPFTDPSEHIAKANMLMVKALIEFVSEPGKTILDPFAGIGTLLVATTIGRLVILIEIEEPFQKIIERNIAGIKRTVPAAEEMVTLIPGDCNRVLPLENFCNHMIFSPPYSNLLRKKGDASGKMDKTSEELGYGSAPLYTANPDNVGNLNDFFYAQRMEQIYKKCFQTITPGGTMTIIIKDRMEAGKRVRLGDRAERDCVRLGFELVARNKWYARGGGYAAINRAHGLETVDEEDLITLRKTLKE